MKNKIDLYFKFCIFNKIRQNICHGQPVLNFVENWLGFLKHIEFIKSDGYFKSYDTFKICQFNSTHPLCQFARNSKVEWIFLLASSYTHFVQLLTLFSTVIIVFLKNVPFVFHYHLKIGHFRGSGFLLLTCSLVSKIKPIYILKECVKFYQKSIKRIYRVLWGRHLTKKLSFYNVFKKINFLITNSKFPKNLLQTFTSLFLNLRT